MAKRTYEPRGPCVVQQRPKQDISGCVFNNWRILGVSHREEGGVWYWNVECINCGFQAKRFTTYAKKSQGCICCGLLPKGETGLNKLMSVIVIVLCSVISLLICLKKSSET